MQDGLVEQTHSCRELAEQPVTCALVHCHQSQTPKGQLSSLFLLDNNKIVTITRNCCILLVL